MAENQKSYLKDGGENKVNYIIKSITDKQTFITLCAT